MKPRKTFIYQICVVVLCLLTNINSENQNDDDLADFDFEIAPTNENQSNYYDENDNESDIFNDFVGIDETPIPNQKNQLIIKEKLLRTALVKALTNKSLRQKFVEVIPILRVLSSQQRLALSALISAQITAKPGTELKLDQVRTMFGNSKKLILPLVFDIANLVRNAAKSTLHFQYELYPQKPKKIRFIENPIISRRDLQLTQDEEDTDSMDGVIDAKLINHELSENLSPVKFPDLTHIRSKRSVLFKPQIDHRIFQERKLNISSFNTGSNQQFPDNVENLNNLNIINSTDEIIFKINQTEDLAMADLNGTEINQFNFNETSVQTGEELPIPESLVSGPRLKKIGNNNIGMGSNLRKVQKITPIRPRPPVHPVTPKSCERFTASMCIRANDYPTDQIMGSIRRHKHAMSALLAEYRDKAAELEYQEYLEELHLNSKRREDQNGVMPGGMCTSIVRYARPQKARSATGEWKFIVNTGQHTQTLRLEKCSNPQESCSYLSENYRSRCLQVYNYHRLLSWDKNRGLHVDIFKIPSCCSCHVDGYRESFPPLGGIKIQDYTPIKNYNNVNNDFGNEDIEYEEEEDDDDSDLIDEGDSVAYQFGNGFKRVRQQPASNQFDSTEFLQLSSTNLNKHFETVKKTNPTLGSFLRPPKQNDFEHQPVFNRGSNQFSGNTFSNSKTRNRRPAFKHYVDTADNRSDLDSSGSIVGKEVTVYPTDEKTTIIQQPKRKHISSVSTVHTTKFTPSIKYTSPTPYANTRGRKKTNNITPTIISSPAITTTTISESQSTIRTKNEHPIYSTKLANIKSDNGNKRINYNYHPIIDFFEDESSSSSSSLAPITLPKSYRGSSNYKSSIIKDNRIGVGTLGDSNWHPVIA